MRIDSITPEQTARFSDWAAKWIEIGLSTAPADFDAATAAALRGYQYANLKKPIVVLRLASPYAATIGGTYAVLMLNEFFSKWSQVGSQVRSQVQSQVESQVWSQVRSQVQSQVGSQVRSQVWSQVGSQVQSQVQSQVGSQVESQVWSQVWSQVRSQVQSQVESQVWSQVRSQVQSQVESQVWSQVESQVRSQVWSQVESQVGSQVRSQVGRSYTNYGLNSLWSSWAAYVSFFRDILGWQDPILERFEVDEALVKSCGWTWWHENVLAISDRPEVINRDLSGRLHSESEMAIRYRDGWGFYSIHGVVVPEQVVVAPSSITKSQIDAEGNAEVKRIMLARYGYEKYLRESDAKLMDSCAADHKIKGLRTAKLYQLTNDVVVLDMLNSTPEPDGTTKRYVLAIDGERYDGDAAKNCHAAMASTWRIKGRETELLFKDFKEYRPGFES